MTADIMLQLPSAFSMRNFDGVAPAPRGPVGPRRPAERRARCGGLCWHRRGGRSVHRAARGAAGAAHRGGNPSPGGAISPASSRISDLSATITSTSSGWRPSPTARSRQSPRAWRTTSRPPRCGTSPLPSAKRRWRGCSRTDLLVRGCCGSADRPVQGRRRPIPAAGGSGSDSDGRAVLPFVRSRLGASVEPTGQRRIG